MSRNRPETETPEYKSWRFHIYSRDRFSCVLCNRSGQKLEAHHIIRWADAPELRYAPSNGVTLCENCHLTVTGREEEFVAKFKQIVADKRQNKGQVKRGLGIKKAASFKQRKWRPRNYMLRF